MKREQLTNVTTEAQCHALSDTPTSQTIDAQCERLSRVAIAEAKTIYYRREFRDDPYFYKGFIMSSCKFPMERIARYADAIIALRSQQVTPA